MLSILKLGFLAGVSASSRSFLKNEYLSKVSLTTDPAVVDLVKEDVHAEIEESAPKNGDAVAEEQHVAQVVIASKEDVKASKEDAKSAKANTTALVAKNDTMAPVMPPMPDSSANDSMANDTMPPYDTMTLVAKNNVTVSKVAGNSTLAAALLSAKANSTAAGPRDFLSKGDACGACKVQEEFLSGPKHIAQTSQGCRCTATDVNAAFANDATKKTQGQVKGVSSGSGDDLHHANEAITENTGAARLAESWKWHCGAITAGMNQQGESTWQEC